MNCPKKLSVLGFVVLLSFVSSITFAEDWQYDSINDSIYTTTGKVGIGTVSPEFLLDIKSSLSSAIRFGSDSDDSGRIFSSYSEGSPYVNFIEYDDPFIFRFNQTRYGKELIMSFHGGNVGIGITYPKEIFEVATYDGNLRLYGRQGIVSAGLHLNEYYDGYQWRNDDVTKSSGSIRFHRTTGAIQFSNRKPNDPEGLATIKTVITADGNVGINTTTPDLNYKLDVNGSIKAKEIKVIVASVDEVKVTDAQWSDFVFEESYKLPSLDHVESYIKENKHLPDVPSAKQIAEEGLSMAEMMAKQMQKIEELTLYVIELKKQNETLAKQSSELKARIASLEERN